MATVEVVPSLLVALPPAGVVGMKAQPHRPALVEELDVFGGSPCLHERELFAVRRGFDPVLVGFLFEPPSVAGDHVEPSFASLDVDRRVALVGGAKVLHTGCT